MSTFQKKKQATKDQDGAYTPPKTRKNLRKQKTLVLIFGKNNVRRASDQRKVTRRIQRYNRRMKSWRKLNGEKALFDWD